MILGGFRHSKHSARFPRGHQTYGSSCRGSVQQASGNPCAGFISFLFCLSSKEPEARLQAPPMLKTQPEKTILISRRQDPGPCTLHQVRGPGCCPALPSLPDSFFLSLPASNCGLAGKHHLPFHCCFQTNNISAILEITSMFGQPQ